MPTHLRLPFSTMRYLVAQPGENFLPLQAVPTRIMGTPIDSHKPTRQNDTENNMGIKLSLEPDQESRPGSTCMLNLSRVIKLKDLNRIQSHLP